MLVYVSVLESGCESASDFPPSPLRQEIAQGVHSSDRILLIDLADQRFAAMRGLVLQMLEGLGHAARKPVESESAEPASALTASKRTSGLTPRELEVLSLSAEGHSYDAIASALQISINTVRYHMKRLNMKLDVHNRVAAIHRARTLGMV